LSALVAIADPDTALATVLGDDSGLVRREALELAGVRTLGADDVGRSARSPRGSPTHSSA
jgi:hypothetical protein